MNTNPSDQPNPASVFSIAKRRILLLLALTLYLSAFFGQSQPEDDPEALQQRGIERVEGYQEHWRRTGDLFSKLRELQLADVELAESYKAFMQRGDQKSAALSLIKRGYIARVQSITLKQDRLAEEIQFYQEAYRLAEQAAYPPYQAKALLGKVRAELHSQNDLEAAFATIEHALPLCAKMKEKGSLFETLDYKAQIQVRRGDLIAAADTLNRAFSLEGEVDDQQILYFGYMGRGELYWELGRKSEGQQEYGSSLVSLELAKENFEKALYITKTLQYKGLTQQTEDSLKRLAIYRTLVDDTKRLWDDLNHLLESTYEPIEPSDVVIYKEFLSPNDPWSAQIMGLIMEMGGFMEADSALDFHIRGQFQQMQNENDAALSSYIDALKFLEADRRSLRNEKYRGTFLENKMNFYYTPIRHYLARHRFAQAFELFERAKSRALADLLASKEIALERPQDQVLFAQLQEINAQIALRQELLYGWRSRADRDNYTEEITQKTSEIEELEKEHKILLRRIEKDAPKLKELVASEPVTLETLKQSMQQEGYEMLQYLVLPHEVILWHISSDAVHVKAVALPYLQLNKKVQKLRNSLTQRNQVFDEQTAKEMFLFLIQPMLEHIQTDHLVISPHNKLHYIPFQVFQHWKDNWFLGERFQISYTPSATILMGLKTGESIAGKSLLAIADKDINEDVEAISLLYSEEDMKTVLFDPNEPETKVDDLKSLAGNYDLLHLSVHGSFDTTEPLLSYILLGKADVENAKFTAAQMFGLPLEQTRMVVLSACETGEIEETVSNEIQGIVRALLYAGSETLVLSSWRVDPEATGLWMETFYNEAQTKSLREAARLALTDLKEDPNYNHPRYWAAFQMIGK